MKSQVSLYIIIGLVVVIVLAAIFLPKKAQQNDLVKLSLDKAGFQSYFEECSKLSVIDGNNRYGLSESTRSEYQQHVSAKLRECSSEYLTKLEEKGLNVTDADITVVLEINDVNAIVTIIYPVSISLGSSTYVYDGYEETFEKQRVIEPQDTVGKNVVSSDNNFLISSDEPLQFIDIYGKPVKKDIVLKIADKREFDGEELESSLVYGITPIGQFSKEPITIKLYVEGFVPPELYNKIRIAWYNPLSNTWMYYADAKVKDGAITTDVHYTSYYGLTTSRPTPNNVPTLGTSQPMIPGLNEPIPQGTSGFGSSSGFTGSYTPPDTSYNNVPGNDVKKIYDTIKAEMHANYVLSVDPNCVPEGGFCWTGSTDRCGVAAIYCTERIYSMSNSELNLLFRHELTHNLQQNNGGCASDDRPMKEWGAEYYAGSTYYAFVMEEGKLLAHVAAEKMLEQPGCTEEILKNAAFCSSASDVALMKEKCLKANELSAYGNSGLN
ncbi:MAG: hypothetical protein NDI94_06005 [Candidatus Woesearchaeota archaeon]|nr:hypothetical protein [Candidatus Woesearchaeota archaeon]